MPLIPYGQPRVAPTPLPGVQRTGAETPESLGAGLFSQRERTALTIGGVAEQAAKLTGGAAIDIAQKAQQRAQEFAFLDAANTFTSTMNDWQRDAYLKKGTDAYGLPDELHDTITRTADGASQNLTDPEQKLQWSRWIAQQRDSLDLSVNRHVDQQRDQAEQQTIATTKANMLDSVALNAADTGKVAEAMQFGEAAMVRAGAWNGMTPENRDRAVAELRSAAWLTVIKRRVDNHDMKGAQAVYDAFGDQIAGQQKADVEQFLTKSRDDQQGLDTANTIIASSTDPKARLDAVAAIKDVTLHDAVLGRIKDQNATDEQGKARAERETLDKAFKVVNDTGGNIDAVPSSWQSAIATSMPGLRAYAASLRAGIPIQMTEKNYGVWAKLRREMTAPDASAFMGEQLKDYLGVLPVNVVMDFEQQQDLMRANVNKAPSAELMNAKMDDDQFNTLAKRYAQLPTDQPASLWSAAQRESIASLHFAVDQAIQAAQIAKGKPLTIPEKTETMKAALSSQVMKFGTGVFGTGLFGTDTMVPAVTVSTDDAGSTYVPVASIPQVNLREYIDYVLKQDPQLARDYRGQASKALADTMVIGRYKDRLQRAAAAAAMRRPDADIYAILRGEK